MTPKTKKILYIVAPLVAGITIIFLLNKKKKADMANAPLISPGQEANAVVENVTTPISSTFPLRIGSNNSKVKELQTLIGVSADGIFGSKTDAALVKFAGVHTVDSQADLDVLKKQAAGDTNLNRATDLVKKFKAGGQDLFVTKKGPARQVIQDSYGALVSTGKQVILPAGVVYNNTDYVLTNTTKGGNVLFDITRGNLVGTYSIDPNLISLKAV